MNRIYFFSMFIYIAFSCIFLHAGLSDITNKFQFYFFGTEDASDAIKKHARQVFAAVGLPEPEKVPVKRMSSLLLSSAKDAGCIATHNAVFVDEEWLLSLPENKIRFVLAHEAIHLKNKDLVKRVSAGAGLAALGIAGIYNYKKLGIVGLGSSLVGSYAAFVAFCRYQEGNADAGAERIAPRAFQNSYVSHLALTQTPYQKTWGWLGSWFSFYPINRFAAH